MTWKSHQIVTAAAAYAMGLPVMGIAVATAASTFPDWVEFLFGLKHRGVSHFWAVYLFLLVIAYFDLLHLGPLSLLLAWFAIGCLCHIVEDSMSKSGVALLPWSKKRIKLGQLYVTRTTSEFYTTVGVVALLFVLKWVLIETGHASLQPGVVFLRKDVLKQAFSVLKLHS